MPTRVSLILPLPPRRVFPLPASYSPAILPATCLLVMLELGCLGGACGDGLVEGGKLLLLSDRLVGAPPHGRVEGGLLGSQSAKCTGGERI